MEKSERDGTAGVFTGDRGGTCFEFHGSHGKERYSTDQLFYDVSDAGSSSDEGIYRNEPDDGCNAWQSQWLYESSGAVLFCGGRFCGEQRWRAGVLRVGDPADRSGAVGAKISSSARRAALCPVFAARPSFKG